MKYSIIVVAILAACSQKPDPTPAQINLPSPMAVGVPDSAKPAPSVPTPIQTKSDKFEALKKEGTGVAAWEAFQLAEKCFRARRANVPTDKCGDLSPGQLTERIVLVQKAAEAGVHGAAFAYGEIIQRSSREPKDNYSDTERWRYFAIGAEHGDSFSLAAMAYQAMQKENWEEALRYAVASDEAIKRDSPSYEPNQDVIQELTKKIGSESKAKEIISSAKAMTFKEVR